MTDPALAYAHHAMQLLRQGLHRQAEACLGEAISLDPANAQWHLELARLQRTYNTALARTAYDAAQSLGSPNAILEASSLYAEASHIEHLPPHALWRPDRLDISVKLLLARHFLGSSPDERADVHALYRKHILQRTKGKEPETLAKSSLEDYETCFMKLIESIKMEGFKDEFAIPVDASGRILGGAHRLSAALALRLESVPVIRMPAPWEGLEWGMAWFLHHGFSPFEINHLLQLWIEAHPDQIGLLIMEHDGSGVPAELMLELKQHFSVLAWRDLHPATSLPYSLQQQGSPLPQGPWRYVLVDANPDALQAFSICQNEQYAYRLNCSAISGAACLTWTSYLLDEAMIASWHASYAHLRGDASSIASWTRYALQSQ